MTHRDHRNGFEVEAQADVTSAGSFQEMLEFLAEHGFEGMAQAMQMLLNEAMKLDRSQVLGAQPYQRTHERRGYIGASSSPASKRAACTACSWSPATITPGCELLCRRGCRV